MSPDVVQHICEQTTLYASSKGSKFEMDECLFKRFLSVLLISGYVVMPRRLMYWQMSDDTHNDAVSSLMSRNKFEECLQYLHLSDNSKLLKDDKYAKVRPLCKLINEKCQQNFIPEKNISIDESMVAYFGRHSTKQYMKAKPTKFGYKIFYE